MNNSVTNEASDMDLSTFDLIAYSSSYQGHTKLIRLEFLMDTFPKLKLAASKVLLEELKNGSNATAYTKILHTVDENIRKELGCKQSTAEVMIQNNQAKMEILEAELLAAKSAVLKEGTRQAYNDIGHLWYQIGNLTEALKSYLRTRDLCSMVRHNCEMSLNVITVSIDLKQFFNVSNFVSKVTDAGGDEVVVAKLKVASALSDLYDQQYHSAALKFLEVNPCLGNQFNNVVSAEDIAIYATICALATFSRTELRTKLIDNKSFVNTYLSLVPDFKAMVLGFCGGKYDQAFSLLTSLRPRLLADLYLHHSVTSIVHMIFERMLLQYFEPYSAVDLGRMASSLQMDAKTLEESLIRLIASGRLSARIDAQSNTMHRRTREVRHATLHKVRALSQVHAHAVKRDILRLSLLRQHFVIGERDENNDGGGLQPQQRGGSSSSSINAEHSMMQMDTFAGEFSPEHDFHVGPAGEDDLEEYEQQAQYTATATGSTAAVSVSVQSSQAIDMDMDMDMDDL